MSYRQGIMKSLEYPVGMTLLNQQECYKIQAPVLSTGLQQFSISSTISREIIHGPLQFGGLQFKNSYSEASIQRIEMFMGHARKSDRTGQILDVAL